MRWLKYGLYALGALLLQTVVFNRLNLFGASPDLILVSVILLAVVEDKKPALFFAAAAGLLQDILSHGIYLNMIVKILAAFLVNSTKEGFVGDEFFLALGAVAVLTPASLIFEGLIRGLCFGRQVDILNLCLLIVLATLYNLVFVPLLLPLIRRFGHA